MVNVTVGEVEDFSRAAGPVRQHDKGVGKQVPQPGLSKRVIKTYF